MSMHYFTAIVKITVLSEEKSSEGDKFSIWFQHKDVLLICCDNGTPDGKGVQAGLTERRNCPRQVGGGDSLYFL
jgi:hypothetical protein